MSSLVFLSKITLFLPLENYSYIQKYRMFTYMENEIVMLTVPWKQYIYKRNKEEEKGSWDEHELKNLQFTLKSGSMAVSLASYGENHCKSLTVLYILGLVVIK